MKHTSSVCRLQQGSSRPRVRDFQSSYLHNHVILHAHFTGWLSVSLQVAVDALARAALPEEEGGRGSTLDKKAPRRIVLVQ
jgi:hypothetical protein